MDSARNDHSRSGCGYGISAKAKVLTNARQQAIRRRYEDVFIVDIDAHHYESDHYNEILTYVERSDPAERDQATRAGAATA